MKWNTAKHYRNVDLVWGQDGQGLLTHHWPNYMWYCMCLCVRVPVFHFFWETKFFGALGIKKGLFASHLVNANAVDAVSNGHVWSRHHCRHTPKNWLIGVLCWDQFCLQGQCPLQATMAGQISWLWFFSSSESNYLVCPGDKSPSLGTFAEIQMASMHSCLDCKIFMTISWATGRWQWL